MDTAAGTVRELQTPEFNGFSDRFNDYYSFRDPKMSVDESRIEKHKNAVSMMTNYALNTGMDN
jgi:hypothetical protein